MARSRQSQPAPKDPGKAASKRLSKLSSFVKALKAGAASMGKKRSAKAKPAAQQPSPAKKAVVINKKSVVKKSARGPVVTTKRAVSKRAIERRKAPRPSVKLNAPVADAGFPIRPFDVKVEASPAPQPPQSRQAGSSAQEPAFSIPIGYGDNRIVLMVKDPWWLYAYWEIQPSVERSARAQLLPNEASGLQTILRVYDVTGRHYPQQPAHASFDISLSGMASNWYIKTDAPNRSFVVEIGLLANTGRFILLARSNVVTPPRYGPSDIIDEEWVTTDEDYWRLFGAAAGMGMGSSQSGMGSIGANLSSAYFSGSWSSTNLYGLNKASPVKGFWCRVNTDLVIHGSAEPHSRVTIQGQPVALRKDGSFSLRLALPAGTQTITVEVTSPDGKKSQTLTPVVHLGWSGSINGEGASRRQSAHKQSQGS